MTPRACQGLSSSHALPPPSRWRGGRERGDLHAQAKRATYLTTFYSSPRRERRLSQVLYVFDSYLEGGGVDDKLGSNGSSPTLVELVRLLAPDLVSLHLHQAHTSLRSMTTNPWLQMLYIGDVLKINRLDDDRRRLSMRVMCRVSTSPLDEDVPTTCADEGSNCPDNQMLHFASAIDRTTASSSSSFDLIDIIASLSPYTVGAVPRVACARTDTSNSCGKFTLDSSFLCWQAGFGCLTTLP